MRCVNIARIILFIINFLAFLLFLSLLGGSVYLLVSRDQYFQYSDTDHSSLYFLIACLSTLTPLALLSSLGCLGPAINSPKLLTTFIVMLVVLLSTVIGSQVYISTSHGSKAVDRLYDDIIKPTLEENMKTYNESAQTEWFWNTIQSNFKCCGLTNSTDWVRVLGQEPSSCLGEFRKQGCVERFSQLGACLALSNDNCEPKFLVLYNLHLPVMLFSLVLAFISIGCRSRGKRTEELEADEDFDFNLVITNQDHGQPTAPQYPPSYDTAMRTRK